jgi:hypothetical protein
MADATGASLSQRASSSDGAAPLLTLVSSALGFKASPVEVQVASATESAGGSSSLGLAMRPLVLARSDAVALTRGRHWRSGVPADAHSADRALSARDLNMRPARPDGVS